MHGEFVKIGSIKKAKCSEKKKGNRLCDENDVKWRKVRDSNGRKMDVIMIDRS